MVLNVIFNILPSKRGSKIALQSTILTPILTRTKLSQKKLVQTKEHIPEKALWITSQTVATTKT